MTTKEVGQLIAPVRVEGAAGDDPVFEYPVPGVYDGINVSGDIKVVCETSEEKSVRLHASQEMADRLILNYKYEGLYFSLAPNTTFAGTLYVKGPGLEQLEAKDQAAIQLKGAHPLSLIKLTDHAKADFSEATVPTNHLNIYISSPEPYTLNGLNAKMISLSADQSARVEMNSIRAREVLVDVEDNAVVCLSGEGEDGCMGTRDFARLDASRLKVATCCCVVKRESSMICNASNVHLYVFQTASFKNENPAAVTVPYTDVPTMSKVRLLSSEDVAQIARHLKMSDSEHERLFQIVCEFVKRKQVYYGSLYAQRCLKHCPDFVLIGAHNWLVYPLCSSGENFYEQFCQCFQLYMKKELPESFELLCQVDEDDVDWTEIPEVRERFQQSPLLDYEETDIEYDD